MCICVSPDALSGNESSSSESPAPASEPISSPSGTLHSVFLNTKMHQTNDIYYKYQSHKSKKNFVCFESFKWTPDD